MSDQTCLDVEKIPKKKETIHIMYELGALYPSKSRHLIHESAFTKQLSENPIFSCWSPPMPDQKCYFLLLNSQRKVFLYTNDTKNINLCFDFANLIEKVYNELLDKYTEGSSSSVVNLTDTNPAPSGKLVHAEMQVFLWDTYFNKAKETEGDDYGAKIIELNQQRWRRLSDTETEALNYAVEKTMETYPETKKIRGATQFEKDLRIHFRIIMKTYGQEKEVKKKPESAKRKAEDSVQAIKKRILRVSSSDYEEISNHFAMRSAAWICPPGKKHAYLVLGNQFGELLLFKATFEKLDFEFVSMTQISDTGITHLSVSKDALYVSDLSGALHVLDFQMKKKAIKNLPTSDGVPIFHHVLYETGDKTYLVVVKGMDLILYQVVKDDFVMYPIATLSSSVTGIQMTSSKNHICIYISLMDGTLSEYHFDGKEFSKRILHDKDKDRSIWGIALSPNSSQLAILCYTTRESKNKYKRMSLITYNRYKDMSIDEILWNVEQMNQNGKFGKQDLSKSISDCDDVKVKEIINEMTRRISPNSSPLDPTKHLRMLYALVSSADMEDKLFFQGSKENVTSLLIFEGYKNQLTKIKDPHSILSICDCLLAFYIKTQTFDDDVLALLLNKYTKLDPNGSLVCIQKILEIQSGKFSNEVVFVPPPRLICPFCQDKVPVATDKFSYLCAHGHPFDVSLANFATLEMKIKKCPGCQTKYHAEFDEPCLLCGFL